MSNPDPFNDDCDSGLNADGEFHTPLERVNFEPGMLLGVEATRSEQDYHRRRLNRHRYWLHGSGTLVGLAVTLQSHTSEDPESDQAITINISPGVGVDGLGREVLCHEPYCLDLRAWLLAQWEDEEARSRLLGDGLSDDLAHLQLYVSARYASCPSGQQPVMARSVNAGTDAVKPSRQKDSVLFELLPGKMPQGKDGWPWQGHAPHEHADSPLSDGESSYIDTASDDDEARARFAAQRIYAVDAHPRALQGIGDPENIARIALAQITIAVDEDSRPRIHSDHIAVNNLLRPMLRTNAID